MTLTDILLSAVVLYLLGKTAWKYFIAFFPLQYIKFYKSDACRILFHVREYGKVTVEIFKTLFLIAKFKEMREEIRREYDKANESVDAAKVALTNPSLVEEAKKQLEALKVAKEKDIENFKMQIDAIDMQIHGVDEKDGEERKAFGLEETLESLRANLHLIEDFIKFKRYKN